MDVTCLRGFADELSAIHSDRGAPPDFRFHKLAFLRKLGMGTGWSRAAELGGLGILAKPSIDELRGKQVDEKTKARTELAGLGTLAAPTAYEVGKSAFGKLRRPAVSQALTRL